MNHGPATLLEVKDLTVEIPGVLGERQIGLRKVSLSVSAGEIVVLAGEAGSGKSLLARLVSGIADPRVKILSGSIEFEGSPVYGKRKQPIRDLRRGPVTVVANAVSAPPDPDRTVRQWLREVRRLAGRNEREWGDCFFSAGLLEPEQLLPRRLAEIPPLTRARLSAVRTMLLGSRLLVSEEVASDLDPLSVVAYHELLNRVREESGLGMLVTTGSLRGVERFADRVVVFFEGGVLESAPPADLFSAPRFSYTREFRACDSGLPEPTRDLATISREALREAEDAVHHAATSLAGPVTG